MPKSRLLIVEDDIDIANMLEIYFGGLHYEVDIAARGSEALEKTRQRLPHIIVLDIMLPDIDGYEVCRTLRTYTRTSHIPVIFLTQKDERSDKLQGLELGADDYITKPFDIEELRLRVYNAIARSERESLTEPHTNLPSGQLIEEQLREIIHKDGWAFIDIRLDHFDAFKEAYGFVASDNILRFTAMLLGEVIDEFGTINDFIGHTGNDHFVIITSEDCSSIVRDKLVERFSEEILTHYNYLDRQKGYIEFSGNGGKTEQSPVISISVGVVSPTEHGFTDIREITELAAEARRMEKV
ncbi:MAG: response regulator [Chloroflexota bacterium]|nr:MAG: response regulator [Chloroflexota bacterium]UCF27422.1 MAG: response regulator [Chloroflexota bacterium]